MGDATSADERSRDPGGWAFPGPDRRALQGIVEARRDVRRFRADPLPGPLLRRLLAAAHAGPSVGHSQPWRFVVVEDPGTRARASVLADRARLAQAAAMDPASGRHLLDLDLEGIREAPVGIVVCCDRRVPAAGVLGRATFPDADMWSCACAIQNLWLTARSEGLGVGWVTLFDPDDLRDLVGAPEGVETLGWLCVGWPDERPPTPGLERRGWSTRRPLDEVVLSERWPAGDGAPPPPPSHLPPAPAAVVAAHDSGDSLLSPPGSLGLLDRTVDRILAVRPARPAGTGPDRTSAARPWGRAALVVAAADHPVTAHGVSAYRAEVTRAVAEAAVAGSSVGAVAAAGAGMEVVVVDAGVAGPPLAGATVIRPTGPTGDLVGVDALSRADADRLVEGGYRLAWRLAGAGCGMIALGEIGVGNTTVAAALAAALLGADPSALVGLGAGSDSAIVGAKSRAVTAALERVRRGAPPRRASAGGLDPRYALAALGGGEIAVLAGVVLGGAAAGSVLVVDGMATGVAALAALEMEPAVGSHLVAGQRSREAGHAAVLAALGLEPLLDLRLRAGEGVGAVLAAQMIDAAVSIRLTAARTVAAPPDR